MTHLIVPVFGDSIDEIRADALEAIDAGATMIELRLDLMEDVSDDDLRNLRETISADIPFLLTYRCPSEGGGDEATDEVRLSRLEALGPIAQFIDVELQTLERSDRNRNTVERSLHRAGVVSQSGGQEVIEQAASRKLVLSRHDHKDRPPSLQGDLVRMAGHSECAVAKLAWRARTIRDNFEAFELLRLSPKPAIAVCMGEDGQLSRVLAKKFGAFGSYAALRPMLESAPGQITLADMRGRFQWDIIDGSTAVYGVIGDAVAHSVSPDVHNACFKAGQINAVYLPMRVSPAPEAFKAFMLEVLARPWLDFRGFSVTVPHKENAYRFIQEQGGELDEPSRKCGAVNTIGVSPDGRLAGWNTDCNASVDALTSALPQGRALTGCRILVLGAGGAARAFAVGALGRGAVVAVANRGEERGRRLASDLHCEFIEWDNRHREKFDVLVNCTTVGMVPNSADSPFPVEAVPAKCVVFDMVYNPLQTKLLRDSSRRGCLVVDGLSMFSRQAAAQFALWTGQTIEPDQVRLHAETALNKGKTGES